MATKIPNHSSTDGGNKRDEPLRTQHSDGMRKIINESSVSNDVIISETTDSNHSIYTSIHEPNVNAQSTTNNLMSSNPSIELKENEPNKVILSEKHK